MREIEGYLINDNYEVIGSRGNILEGHEDEKGYIRFHRRGCQTKFKHKLIAKAYPEICGEWFKGCVVHHIDRNKKNNDPHNLIVMTKEEHNKLHFEDKKDKLIQGSKTESCRKKQIESAPKRAVVQLKDGVFINEYTSIREAGRQTGISHKAIQGVCVHRKKHAGGYEWKYKEDNI